MLKKTFCHLPGIGEKKENQLWESGIDTWEKFLSADHPYPELKPLIVQSLDSLSQKDIGFFASKMASDEHWRLYGEFGDKTAFLDIETTGLSYRHDITLIGLYGKDGYKSFVQGENLDSFSEEIRNYDMVVTFNGIIFDLPFIRAKYPEIKLPPAHADLRFTLQKLGYRGGLKKIEEMLGISRSEETTGLNGYSAVILWQRYLMGDKTALNKLIRYNEEDTANLKSLLELAYAELSANIADIYDFS